MVSKTLVVGPSWVGDMVMAQTLFMLLKRINPQGLIDVLAPSWTFALLNRMPEVNTPIELGIGHGELQLRKRMQIAKALRERLYDQAIILPNSLKAALIPWWARIPKRTGWLGEYRYGFINDYRYLDEAKYPLMIERFMALALEQKAPLPDVYPQPQLSVSKDTIKKTLQQLGLSMPEKPVLALSPGAEFGPSKRWPLAYYAEIAKHYLEIGWHVWLFGSVKDRAVTSQINQLNAGQCFDVAGLTSLEGTIDLLSVVNGLITNDSGLMHVASALNKPVIAIYGSTSPKFTPPLSKKAKILQKQLACQPCFKRTCPLKHHQCMVDIKPFEVLAAMESWDRTRL